MSKSLTPDEQEFVKTLVESLPPVIARKDVQHFLGGIVAPQTLTNADFNGTGPEVSYKVGRNIAYRTDSLVTWIVARLGVSRVANLKTL